MKSERVGIIFSKLQPEQQQQQQQQQQREKERKALYFSRVVADKEKVVANCIHYKRWLGTTLRASKSRLLLFRFRIDCARRIIRLSCEKERALLTLLTSVYTNALLLLQI